MFNIVSIKFKIFCETNFDQKFSFLPLKRHKDFFCFNVLDLPIIETNKEWIYHPSKRCDICGFLPSFGSTQILPEQKMENWIYRSDILLSDPGREHPVIIISPEVYEIFRREKFSGIDISPMKYKPLPEGVIPGLKRTVSAKNSDEGAVSKIDQRKEEEEFIAKYSNPIPMEELGATHFQKYPIWTWALDFEVENGYDETWVMPIINTTDVKDKMIDVFISLKDEDNNIYFASYYTDEECISTVYKYEDGDYKELKNIEFMKYPVLLKSIPSINGRHEVLFKVNYNQGKSYIFRQ